MSVLNDKRIKECCEKYQMIYHFNDDRVQPASYDLSVGDEYRFSHEKEIKNLGRWRRRLKIPPYTICYVLVKERLNIPENISAEIFPRHKLVREGLLMYPQPPIDPGYTGKLYVLIHNLTNEDRFIEKDEHLITIVFHELTDKADKPYDGDYRNKETLEGLGLYPEKSEPYTSALKEISEKIKLWREGLLSKWIPILLILMTVFLMVLTILFVVLTILFGWNIP